LVTGREWELNPRHHGNGIEDGNELMGMGGNGNVASHTRTPRSHPLQKHTPHDTAALYDNVVHLGPFENYVRLFVHFYEAAFCRILSHVRPTRRKIMSHGRDKLSSSPLQRRRTVLT